MKLLLDENMPMAALARQIAATLQARQDWEGNFSVVEPDRIRMTPLPDKGPRA